MSLQKKYLTRPVTAPMIRLVDTCIACSRAFGEWLYGKYLYTFLNNVIDLNRFRFSETTGKHIAKNLVSKRNI